jgi:gamma-glutamylcyclotransferase (GGCT)/AIG2-like uncharacterized protein YtfP
MCIIILDKRQSTERIPRAVAERAFEKNPHGMGLMYATGTELRTWRSLDDFEGLWNRYTGARDRGLPIALHFRWNTRGENNVDNCHPFTVEPGFAFMHNGTVLGLDKLLPDGVSDSQYMRDELFPYLPGDFLSRPLLTLAVEKLIDGDRLLFMDQEGNYSILNEQGGAWEWGSEHDEGVWFSHTRNRYYLLNGDYKQVVHHNPTRGPHQSRGSVQQSTDTDRHADHRSAADKWNTRTGGEVIRAEDSDAGPVKHDSKTSDVKHNLLFDYGSLLNGVPESFQCVGDGVLKRAHLWAVKTADGECAGVLPTAVSFGIGVKGKIYSIPEKWWDSLAMLDSEEAPVYQRRLMKAVHEEYGTMEVWAYTADTVSEHSEIIAPVPLGDWGEWLRRGRDGEPLGLLGTVERQRGRDGWGVVKCRGCSGENTQLHSSELAKTGTVTMVYCGDCKVDLLFQGTEEMVR